MSRARAREAAQRSGWPRDLWAPALVALLGGLVSLALWGLLVADRREQVLAGARDTAAESREAVERSLVDQLETIRGLRDLWAGYGLRTEAEWKENAGQRVDRVPGMAAVAWVDLDDPENRMAIGQGGREASLSLDLEDARRHLDAPFQVGPERARDGGVGYRIFLPVRTPEGHDGVLAARFEIAPLLEQVLRARARGYALSVLWGGEEVFTRGVPSSARWQEWWRVEERVPLPLGGSWRIVHRPTAELAAQRLTPLPHYLLGAGLLLSLVLALATYQMRLILRQSRFLGATNRALEQRGSELEQHVSDRTEALQEAVAELEAFNYSVSHDLRSPLGAILNFASILREDHGDALGADGSALLERIQRSASRATNLLEGLLQLSRAGRADLRVERVDMTALARESFAQVGAAEADLDLQLVVEPLPPAYGDRALLGNVLANLIGNAVKYSRGCEKRRIRLSGRIEGKEGIYEVEDNGKGFDMRYQDKLFRVFERLHSDDGVEGTGVGLAIVARIVRRHRGRVWAEGRPGVGARFCFALPMGDAS